MAGTTEHIFLGRQPILDRNQGLVAYELLFRSSRVNHAEVTDNAQATATVIANAFLELGIGEALGACRGFINVDEAFLFSDLLHLLPRDSVVLEILETVPPTPAVIERCTALRAAGYRLALDDVTQLEPAYAELITLVDIIKIDIQPLSESALSELVASLRPLGKTLLAEKVDSRPQMRLCHALGFSLFQGYYFARPSVLAGKRLEHGQSTLIRLLALVYGDAETSELEAAFKHQPGLTMNLLRLTNSVAAGLSTPVSSLAQAITFIGRQQLQRWLQLLAFTSGEDNPAKNPLLQLAATRGRLMELLAAELRPGDRPLADQAFMVGIMSLMPALIAQPMREIIAPLPLASIVCEALCDGRGQLGTLLQVALAGETGDLRDLTQALAHHPSLTLGRINRAQTEALAWANQLTA